MYKLFFSILLPCIFLVKESYSQSTCSFSVIQNISLCIEHNTDNQTSTNMNLVVDKVLSNIGLNRKNFIIKSCNNIQNAIAVIHNSNRYIMMDEHFFNSISDNNKIAYYLIISHELAHHLNGHTADYQKYSNQVNQQKELECDYFAGYILCSFGFSLDNVIKEATNLLYDPNYNSNSSHPSLNQRISTIRKGFNDFEKKEDKRIKDIFEIVQEDYKKSFEQNFTNQLTYLYNDARESFLNVISNNKITGINEVIAKYQKLDYFSKDLIHVKADLGLLNYRNGNFSAAYNYFLTAYDLSKDDRYLIDALQVSYDGGLNIDYAKYEVLKTTDFNKLGHPNRYKFLAIYLVDVDINKSKEVLIYALNNWSMFHLFEWESFLKANLLSDLSVLHLRNREYKESYSVIKRVIELYEVEKIKNKDISDFDKKDISIVLNNKALIELRMKNWEQCIKTSKFLIEQFPDSECFLNGDIDYYIGRSFLEVEDYANAIIYLSTAIKKSAKNDYLYYYRGIAYSKLGNSKKATIDFTISCDKNLQEACEKLN